MKKWIMSVAAAVLFGFAANAQEDMRVSQDISKNEVPGEVMESFNEEFASAKDVEWERKGNCYSADFDLLKEDKEVFFDNSGNVTIVRTDMWITHLPDEVRNTLETHYAEYRADDIYKLEKDGKVMYKVEAKNDGETTDIIFDPFGRVLQEKYRGFNRDEY